MTLPLSFNAKKIKCSTLLVGESKGAVSGAFCISKKQEGDYDGIESSVSLDVLDEFASSRVISASSCSVRFRHFPTAKSR